MNWHLLLLLYPLWQFATPAMSQKTLFLRDGSEPSEGISVILPTREVTSVSDGVLVTYEFDAVIVQDDPFYLGACFCKIAGFGQNGTAGEPAVPIRWDSFSIPDGWVDASISVVESAFTDIPMQLSPARPPLLEGKSDSLSEGNVVAIIPYEGWFPQEIVQECPRQVYRGKSLLGVGLTPVQYDYKNRIVRAYTKIVYKVSFQERKKIGRSLLNSNITADDHFLNNTTLNGNEIQPLTWNIQNTTSSVKDYLIISVPKYEEAVNRFADWKRTLGFCVHIKMKDYWTPETIKAEVSDVYHSNESLYYLLIVGDHEDVPAQKDTISKRVFVTDLFYGCMDGPSDYLPDIYRGRLSVSSPSEAMTVVNKIIKYEKNPVHDESFYNTGLHCAYFEDELNDKNYVHEDIYDIGDGYADRRFTQISEEIRNYMLSKNKAINRVYLTNEWMVPTHWNDGRYSFGEPIPEELLKPGFAWNGNSSDIINYINEGVFYVLHRGHGEDTYWVYPYFTISDIDNLHNGDKLPVVFSINCLTGKFNGKTCLAETFLRKKDGGCVAIYGATEVSYSGYNDALSEGMFDAIWPSPGLGFKIPGFNPVFPQAPTPTPTYCLGQILDQGMMRMEETWGTHITEDTKYTREVFHCFGDPAMKIYTDIPTEFSNATINRTPNSIHVDLGTEVGNIIFYNEQTGKISFGSGTIGDYSGDENYVRVCISGHNKIPLVNLPYDILYIQNDTIRGPKNYESDVIKVGANVTEEKPGGKAVFDGGKITLKGKSVKLDRGTIILPKTQFEVKRIK